MRFITKLALAGLATIAVAGVTHMFAVARLPTGVMERVFAGGAAAADGVNRMTHADLATGATRQVPMPSPDIVYSLCVVDARSGPVTVSGAPGGSYWSISVFDVRSDNVFTLNDEAAPAGRDAVVTLVDAARPQAGAVALEGGRGVALLRVLVADRRDPAQVEAARQVQRRATCRQGP